VIISYITDVTRQLPAAEAALHQLPCFGDQPLIGADQFGFYITTMNSPIFVADSMARRFIDVQAALVPAIQPPRRSFAGLPLAEVKLLASNRHNPAGGAFERLTTARDFMSALQFGGISAQANVTIELQSGFDQPSSLDTATPSLQLTNVVVDSESYANRLLHSNDLGRRPCLTCLPLEP